MVRVAAECAADLAADGVVYAEVRYAPELHTCMGLTLDEVVQAVLEGFRLGSEGRDIRVGSLLTAMRHQARSKEIAELAVRYRDLGVVGFDIAGAEAYSKNPTPGGDISGIVTNNAKRTITIRLATPRGDFLTILALLFAAPVPPTTDPSIQNGSIPGTGPYKFSNYDPNRSFTMVRNPYFKPTKYIPKGNPNTIDVQLVGDADADGGGGFHGCRGRHRSVQRR